MAICSFSGKYRFLSNFYEVEVPYNGLTYQNSEAAFQAQKQPQRSQEFVNLSAIKAKGLGRKVQLRADWYGVRDRIMYEVCLAKFTAHEYLKQMLIATGDEELIEGNDMGDKYWGVCNGEDENRLGKILMRIRAELKQK